MVKFENKIWNKLIRHFSLQIAYIEKKIRQFWVKVGGDQESL